MCQERTGWFNVNSCENRSVWTLLYIRQLCFFVCQADFKYGFLNVEITQIPNNQPTDKNSKHTNGQQCNQRTYKATTIKRTYFKPTSLPTKNIANKRNNELQTYQKHTHKHKLTNTLTLPRQTNGQANEWINWHYNQWHKQNNK